MSRRTQKEVITQRMSMVKKLEKELEQIRIAQHNLGYIELDKPIRDGWFKSFRLRDDVARSKMAKVYQEVLDAVLQEIWGREKKHADKKWRKFFNRHHRNFQRPGVRRLGEKEYQNLSSKAQRCFIKRRRKGHRGYVNFYSCILPRYYFQITYRRAYITRWRVISPVLKSRETEIREILSSSELWSYSSYNCYHHRYWFNPHKIERRKTKVILCNKNELLYKSVRKDGLEIYDALPNTGSMSSMTYF